jgi:GDPmannose 4,6-dehydratase
MRRAIVIGSEGQDGAYLRQQLVEEGVGTIAVGRNRTYWCGGEDLETVDITRAPDVERLVLEHRPDEVYYVAGFHHSAEGRSHLQSGEAIETSFAVHVGGLVNVLEAMRRYSPGTRMVYASSCLVFGESPGRGVGEDAPLAPDSVYAISKAAGMQLCRWYRASAGLHAAVGILFNHDSPLRRGDFLSKRIIRAARALQKGDEQEIEVGDLDACIDWGWAPDYTNALTRIARSEVGDDFVVATGEGHTVGELVAKICALAGVAPRIRSRPEMIARKQVVRVGNPEKLMQRTGWKPSIDFEGLVERLWAAVLRAEEESCPTC